MKKTKQTIEINKLINKYALEKRDLKSHLEIIDYFENILNDPNKNMLNCKPSEFKGFLHHLKWHDVKNIFKKGKIKYKPLNRLKFLCTHLEIPMYEFLKIFGLFNCKHPDFNMSKKHKNDQKNLDQFLKQRSSVYDEVYGFICDSISRKEAWTNRFKNIEFDFKTIEFTVSKIKKPGTGIPGSNLDKSITVIWAICILYKIPFYEMLNHLDVLSEYDNYN